MIETTTRPLTVAVAPLASVVIEYHDADLRTLNCFECGTVTIHTRTADGFVCSACDAVQVVIVIEDFYQERKRHEYKRTAHQ
jgi:hypothetical protein